MELFISVKLFMNLNSREFGEVSMHVLYRVGVCCMTVYLQAEVRSFVSVRWYFKLFCLIQTLN